MPKYIFSLTLEGTINADTFQEAFEKMLTASKELEKKVEIGEAILSDLQVDNIYPGLHAYQSYRY